MGMNVRHASLRNQKLKTHKVTRPGYRALNKATKVAHSSE